MGLESALDFHKRDMLLKDLHHAVCAPKQPKRVFRHKLDGIGHLERAGHRKRRVHDQPSVLRRRGVHALHDMPLLAFGLPTPGNGAGLRAAEYL